MTLALSLMLYGLVGGMAWSAAEAVRHERARRRANRTILAPLPAVDELPDEWPPRRVLAVVDDIEYTY